MRAIICKMCGSSDVIKKGDVYICQYCGTKHLLDEPINTENRQNESKYSSDTFISNKDIRKIETRKIQKFADKFVKYSFVLLGVLIIVLTASCFFAEPKEHKVNTPVSDKLSKAREQRRADEIRKNNEINYKGPQGKFANLPDLEKLSLKNHPRVLDTVDQGLHYWRDMGTRKFYFMMVGENDIFGANSNENILALVGNKIYTNSRNSNRQEIKYISNAILWFYKINSQLTVDYNTAIKITDGYIPKETINKYYKLVYSHKYIPIDGSFGKTCIYEQVYQLSDTTVENNKMPLPMNFRIYMMCSKKGSILSSEISCTHYKDEQGHINDILKKGYSITKWDYSPL